MGSRAEPEIADKQFEFLRVPHRRASPRTRVGAVQKMRKRGIFEIVRRPGSASRPPRSIFCAAGSCGCVKSMTLRGCVKVGHSMQPLCFIAAMHSASRSKPSKIRLTPARAGYSVASRPTECEIALRPSRCVSRTMMSVSSCVKAAINSPSGRRWMPSSAILMQSTPFLTCFRTSCYRLVDIRDEPADRGFGRADPTRIVSSVRHRWVVMHGPAAITLGTVEQAGSHRIADLQRHPAGIPRGTDRRYSRRRPVSAPERTCRAGCGVGAGRRGRYPPRSSHCRRRLN